MRVQLATSAVHTLFVVPTAAGLPAAPDAASGIKD